MKDSGGAQWSKGTQSWLQQEGSQSKPCDAHPALDTAGAASLAGLPALCPVRGCRIKARCSWIPSPQVSFFQCWRRALPSLGARKTWFVCTGPHSERVLEQRGGRWPGAAASTRCCCRGQAKRQDTPRRSRINWQGTLRESFPPFILLCSE